MVTLSSAAVKDGTILLWNMNEAPLNIEEQNGASQQDQTNAETNTEQWTTTPQTPQQIAEKALASTVALTALEANGNPSGYGSGFFVRPGYILRLIITLLNRQPEFTLNWLVRKQHIGLRIL